MYILKLRCLKLKISQIKLIAFVVKPIFPLKDGVLWGRNFETKQIYNLTHAALTICLSSLSFINL